MVELSQYTLEQVAEHNTRETPWLIIHDKVYDVQRFLDEPQRSKKQIKSKSYDDVPSSSEEGSSWKQWVIMLGLGMLSVLVYRYYQH